jgi:MoaA/NifB/PqqE/SkfB family radical SAM enzyme
MGNVNEQSLDTIWNSEKYRDFRRRMNAKDYPEVCRTCDVLVANPHFDKRWLATGSDRQAGDAAR